MAEGELRSVKGVMQSFEQRFIDALQNSLKDKDRFVKGLLWQSVKAEAKVLGQSVSLEIKMDDYWKFVDEGVDGYEHSVGSDFKYKKDGKNIPVDAMMKFIASRGITLRSSNIATHRTLAKLKGKGKLAKKLKKAIKLNEYKSLAFALGKTIKKKGIKPTHFASEVMEGNLIKEFKRELSLSVGREIKIEIAKVK